ncbi:uncharacterized protein LOC114939104 [Nylanderia fulva]|uniref:uncharacterized protein LOC114939104 n=1 Tax=Nylanderia fulva TaxID=613905 RepID=UPI0010FB09B4|nr:uncharacterized protein LOC114939104 [Nylanderia fulva]
MRSFRRQYFFRKEKEKPKTLWSNQNIKRNLYSSIFTKVIYFTSEITGYVSSIFTIKSYEKNDKKWDLFNFILSTGETTIQVTAWNNLAFKYASLITETERLLIKHAKQRAQRKSE